MSAPLCAFAMAAVAASSLGLKAANASQALLERTQFTGSFDASERAAVSRGSAARKLVQLRAQQQQQDEPQMQSRRSMFGLVATSVAAGILAVEEARAASSIKITGPPPPSGGLPGTENADQPRDLDLPLKQRSFIQPLSPTEAVSRVKEASKDIIGVKDLIAKKSWPYVRNDLRNKATYLRYDLSTIISAKPKDERKELKLLYTKLFDTMDKLDYAARMKDPAAAEKGYSETVAALDNVIAKL